MPDKEEFTRMRGHRPAPGEIDELEYFRLNRQVEIWVSFLFVASFASYSHWSKFGANPPRKVTDGMQQH